MGNATAAFLPVVSLVSAGANERAEAAGDEATGGQAAARGAGGAQNRQRALRTAPTPVRHRRRAARSRVRATRTRRARATQRLPSSARPPPVTMQCTRGWKTSSRVQV